MRIAVWSLALALTAVAACGDDSCSYPGDCASGQSCVWSGSYGCYTTCETDDDCDEGQSCVPDGASCKHCPDIIMICE
jgi:hypothetical protein